MIASALQVVVLLEICSSMCAKLSSATVYAVAAMLQHN